MRDFIEAQKQHSAEIAHQQVKQTNAMMGLIQSITLHLGHTTGAPTPQPPQSAADAAPENQVPKNVDTPKLNHIPEELTKVIHRKCRAFKDDVLKFSRCSNAIDKLSSDIARMSRDPTAYPPGIKPWKTSLTNTELDQPLETQVDQKWVAASNLPQDCTRRDAIHLIHQSAMTQIKRIELESLTSQLESRRKAASIEQLNEITQQAVKEASKPDCASTLGLTKPIEREVHELAIQAKVDSIYTKIYDEINARLEKEKADANAAASKKEEVPPIPPAELLTSVIDKRLHDTLVTHSLIIDNGMTDQQNIDADAAEASNTFVQSMTKNYQSPSKGAGHNRKADSQQNRADAKSSATKGKNDSDSKGHSHLGKGKGKIRSKGKGKQCKGKGWPKQTGKGLPQKHLARSPNGNGGKNGGGKGKGNGKRPGQ